MARLVNKQFNSPIGLYSEDSIREVIERDSQILANGAIGINFNNPTVGKPGNLQNSAVLRMLEEEEQRQRSGQSPSNDYSRPLRDQITWPPPDYEHPQQRSSFKDVVTPGVKRVTWPPPNEGENYVEQSPVQSQGGPQYSSQSPTLQNSNTSAQHSPSQRIPLKPLDISNGTANFQQSSASSLASQSPLGYQSANPNKQWAPVQSPVGTPGQTQVRSHYQQTVLQQYQTSGQSNQFQSYQPLQQYQVSQLQQYPVPQDQYQSPQAQYQAPQTQYQAPQPQQRQTPQPQQYQPLPQQYQPSQPQNQIQSGAATNQGGPPYNQSAGRVVEPPPSTITLRLQAPVSQAPPPVVTSQPATATLKGGKNLRGDLKWPPENVRLQMAEERNFLLELEKGPACKPRLVRKDYVPFFAQHALNSSYPGYKAPPGTQFYEHNAAY